MENQNQPEKKSTFSTRQKELWVLLGLLVVLIYSVYLGFVEFESRFRYAEFFVVFFLVWQITKTRFWQSYRDLVLLFLFFGIWIRFAFYYGQIDRNKAFEYSIKMVLLIGSYQYIRWLLVPAKDCKYIEARLAKLIVITSVAILTMVVIALQYLSNLMFLIANRMTGRLGFVDFYSVVDRGPRVYPGVNETGGGILAGWI